MKTNRNELRLNDLVQAGEEISFQASPAEYDFRAVIVTPDLDAPRRRVFTGREVAGGALKAGLIGAGAMLVVVLAALAVSEARGAEPPPIVIWGAFECEYDAIIDGTVCEAVPPAATPATAGCDFESGCDGRLRNVIDGMRSYIFGAFAAAGQ